MRDYNIDRERMSSDEISTFKDFKSIMRKHAQTTEDLAKINSSKISSGLLWGIGGTVSVIAVSLFFALSGNEEAVVKDVVVAKPITEVAEAPKIEWQTVIRTPKESIEEVIGLNMVSADRVDYAEFSNIKEVNALLKGVKKTDADFITNSLVFKLSDAETLEISNTNDLFMLNKNGEWDKVAFNPVDMPYVEKPVLWNAGELAVRMNFDNFNGPASKYKNLFWKPVDRADMDDSFFTTAWEDASVEKSDVEGVYTLTFKLGETVKRFNGYPALPKKDYQKAMKDYNAKLLKIQEEVKTAPKTYSVSKGVYTIK